MSTTTEPTVDTNAPTVTRNGIAKTFIMTEFGKKSNNPGIKFYTPGFSVGNFDEDVKWAGLDWILSLAGRTARKMFGELHLENIDPDTGKLNLAAWMSDAEDFTAGVAKLSDLEDEIEELIGQSQVYLLDERFGETDDTTGQPTEYALELSKNAVRLSQLLKPLRALRADIKSRCADRVAKRDANKAALEATKIANAVTA